MNTYTDAELLLLCNLLQMRSEDILSKDKKKRTVSPFRDIWITENMGVSIEKMIEHVDIENLRSNKQLRKHNYDGEISGYEWADMVEVIRSSEIRKLKLMKLEIDDKKAMSTYFINEAGRGYVVFRGTGVGEWKDNFMGGYESDTEQQKRALHFISSIENEDLVVTGHSKGGNKAKYVALMSDKVARCVSFDGQGFSQNFIEKYQDRVVSNKYKITCYALDNDFVNILLFDIYEKKIFIQGSGVTSFAQNHSSDSFFTFSYDDEGHVSGYTLQPSKQGKALKTFHEFVNYIANTAKSKERKRLFNFLGDIAQMTLGQKESGESYTKKEIEAYIRKPQNFLQLVIFLNYIREYEFHGNKISDAVIDIMSKQFGERKNEEFYKVVKRVLVIFSTCHFAIFESYKVLLGYHVEKGDRDYDMTENEVVRDFSQEMQKELLNLAKEVGKEKIWHDSKWDIWYRVEQRLRLLKGGRTEEEKMSYYKKQIDMHGTSYEQMEELFKKVDRIEFVYCDELQGHIAKMKEISSKMKLV